MSRHTIQSTITSDELDCMTSIAGDESTSYLEANPISCPHPMTDAAWNASTYSLANETPNKHEFPYDTAYHDNTSSAIPFEYDSFNTEWFPYDTVDEASAACKSPQVPFHYNTELLRRGAVDDLSDMPVFALEQDKSNDEIMSHGLMSEATSYAYSAEWDTSSVDIPLSKPSDGPSRACGPKCNALCNIPYHEGGYREMHCTRLLYMDNAHLVPHWPPEPSTYLGAKPTRIQAFVDTLLRSRPRGCLISDPCILMQYYKSEIRLRTCSPVVWSGRGVEGGDAFEDIGSGSGSGSSSAIDSIVAPKVEDNSSSMFTT